MKEDVETHKTKLVKVNGTANTILENCENNTAKEIRVQVDNLNKIWKNVVDSVNQQNDTLKRAFDKIQSVVSQIEEFEKWLNNVETEIPSVQECDVTNSNDLFQMKSKFQSLKDKCDERTQEFRNLNETGEFFFKCFLVIFM